MMRKIKGCGNELCSAHKKKIFYKKSEVFCSNCGSLVVSVCRDCYTQMPDDAERRCVRCLAQREDKKDRARKVGGGVLAFGGLVLTFGKKVFNAINKVKV